MRTVPLAQLPKENKGVMFLHWRRLKSNFKSVHRVFRRKRGTELLYLFADSITVLPPWRTFIALLAVVRQQKDTLQFCPAVSDTPQSVSWYESQGGSTLQTRTTSKPPARRFLPAQDLLSSYWIKHKHIHKHIGQLVSLYKSFSSCLKPTFPLHKLLTQCIF